MNLRVICLSQFLGTQVVGTPPWEWGPTIKPGLAPVGTHPTYSGACQLFLSFPTVKLLPGLTSPSVQFSSVKHFFSFPPFIIGHGFHGPYWEVPPIRVRALSASLSPSPSLSLSSKKKTRHVACTCSIHVHEYGSILSKSKSKSKRWHSWHASFLKVEYLELTLSGILAASHSCRSRFSFVLVDHARREN